MAGDLRTIYPLLTPEDEVVIREITKRCCNAPWETVYAEVQYTALYFQTKAKRQERERMIREIEEDVEYGYGDARTGDVILIQMTEKKWQALKEGK